MKFHQLPSDKLGYIRSLQKEDRQVMMLGDGLNDAGALQQSNVGISITDEIAQFSPASDAIMQSKNFTRFPAFIRFSKMAMKVIVGSFIISFTYNIVGISFAILGMLTPLVAAILMPLSNISVVVFATISVNLIARRFNFL